MRAILHSDLNNFYASVECLDHPELKDIPVVVGGAEEERHGIVLAKNMIAKAAGITTGMSLWEARKLCPNVVYFRANFSKYLKMSSRVKDIYRRFTDQIESFGIDECWLDVTYSQKLFGTPFEIAEKIRHAVFEETGLTVSIGVSFCKVFAKLGSDIKKPNATTIVSKENFKRVAWPLPASDMLGIGRKTANKLESFGIHTIGDLANADQEWLENLFGKNGVMISQFARGEDNSLVFESPDTKSVGNSMTYFKDITTKKESSALLLLLSESVAARTIEAGLGFATTVHLYVIESDLFRYTRQTSIEPSCLATDFLHAAQKLLEPTHDQRKAIRGLGVSISGFVKERQSSLLSENYEKNETAQNTIEKLRNKFGREVLHRGLILEQEHLSTLNVKDGHNLDPSKL